MEQKVVAQVGRVLLLLGPPVALTLAELAHPLWSSGTVYQAVAPVADRWLLVHVVLVAGFALTALGLASLLGDRSDPAARAARLLLGLFVVGNTALIAIDGLATGLLVDGARALPATEQAGVEKAIEAMWHQPLTNVFSGLGAFGFMAGILLTAVALYPRSQTCLALTGVGLTMVVWELSSAVGLLGDMSLAYPLGAAAWAIGLVTACYVVHDSGRASFPFAFLVLGAVGFQHTPPWGPIGLVALLVGLAGREIVESRPVAREVAQPVAGLHPGF
jgi:hypothetical protein